MKTKDDIKELLIDYLLKQGEWVEGQALDYCLNEVEAGFGKRAFKGRLEIDIKGIRFVNWDQFYNDLKQKLDNL